MSWHKGEPLKFNKKIDEFFFFEMSRPKAPLGRPYLVCVFRSGPEFYYSIRYWKPNGETPWTEPKLIDDGEFRNRVQGFIYSADKYPQAFSQIAENIIQPFYVNPDDLPEIKEIEKGNPGEEKFIGNAWRRILSAEVGLTPPLDSFNHEKYKALVTNSGINILREDMIDANKYGHLLNDHIEWARKSGIKLIPTMKDYYYEWGDVFGDLETNLKFLSNHKDVIFACEAHNEFMDYKEIDGKPIDKVVDENVELIKKYGIPSAAGAWGNSNDGRSLSEEFLSKCKPDYITMHRPYGKDLAFNIFTDYLKKLCQMGKVIHTEFLPIYMMSSGIPVGEIESYVKAAFDIENFKVFITYGNEFSLMGRLCKELNGR